MPFDEQSYYLVDVVIPTIYDIYTDYLHVFNGLFSRLLFTSSTDYFHVLNDSIYAMV